jgi:hypothetical protein
MGLLKSRGNQQQQPARDPENPYAFNNPRSEDLLLNEVKSLKKKLAKIEQGPSNRS